MTPSSDTVTASAVRGVTALSSVSGEGLPALVRSVSGAAGCSPTASCRRSSERRRFERRRSASGNRRRDPGSRRPAPAGGGGQRTDVPYVGVTDRARRRCDRAHAARLDTGPLTDCETWATASTPATRVPPERDTQRTRSWLGFSVTASYRLLRYGASIPVPRSALPATTSSPGMADCHETPFPDRQRYAPSELQGFVCRTASNFTCAIARTPPA